MVEKYVIIPFGIGIFFLCFGLFLFAYPVFDYTGIQPRERISISHTQNIFVNHLYLKFIANTDPQKIQIEYSFSYNVINYTNIFAIVIPYDVTIENMTEDWNVKPINNAVVIYKNYSCASSFCSTGNSYQYINMILNTKLDTKKTSTHYIQLPFSDYASESDNFKFISNLPHNVNSTMLIGWNTKGDNPSEVSIILHKEYDDWETQPVARIESYLNPEGGNDVVLHWQVIGNNPLFIAKYSNNEDRVESNNVQQMTAFSFGFGVSMIIAAISLHQAARDKSDLKLFIKGVEEDTDKTLKNIEKRELNDIEVTISSTYANLFKLYRLTQSFLISDGATQNHIGMTILSYIPSIENDLSKCARTIDKDAIYKLKEATSNIQGQIMGVIIAQLTGPELDAAINEIESSLRNIKTIVDEEFYPRVAENLRMPDWDSPF